MNVSNLLFSAAKPKADIKTKQKCRLFFLAALNAFINFLPLWSCMDILSVYIYMCNYSITVSEIYMF